MRYIAYTGTQTGTGRGPDMKKKNNLISQIEQACRDKEIDYNDLIELGLKYQSMHIDEIVKEVKEQTKRVREFIGNREPDTIAVITKVNMSNLN